MRKFSSEQPKTCQKAPISWISDIQKQHKKFNFTNKIQKVQEVVKPKEVENAPALYGNEKDPIT